MRFTYIILLNLTCANVGLVLIYITMQWRSWTSDIFFTCNILLNVHWATFALVVGVGCFVVGLHAYVVPYLVCYICFAFGLGFYMLGFAVLPICMFFERAYFFSFPFGFPESVVDCSGPFLCEPWLPIMFGSLFLISRFLGVFVLYVPGCFIYEFQQPLHLYIAMALHCLLFISMFLVSLGRVFFAHFIRNTPESLYLISICLRMCIYIRKKFEALYLLSIIDLINIDKNYLILSYPYR